MSKKITIIIILVIPFALYAQEDSLNSKILVNVDFRFRIEHDWNSRKSNGSFRDDRTRLRYRLRAGVEYNYNSNIKFGARIRTGDPRKQQDPQLTLGDGFKEFGILPIGFEKVYFLAKKRGLTIWGGKNTFPFEKKNELFWSDNVYPEGLFLAKEVNFESKILSKVKFSGGHFIIKTRKKTFDYDSYFQGWQISSKLFKNKIHLFPSFYILRNIQNIPDDGETFLFNYSIFHLGTQFRLKNNPSIKLELDFYKNLEDYSNNDSIPSNLKEQKSGIVVGLGFGNLEKKDDFVFKATFSYLQRYAAVDFLAQNDWARWDYSSFGSPDGRLTNFKGIELVGGYMIDKNITLTMKYYLVEQLISYGIAKETGNRIRLDLDIKF